MGEHTDRRIKQALEALAQSRGAAIECSGCGEVLLSADGLPTDKVDTLKLEGGTGGERHFNFTCKCGEPASEVSLL